MAITLRTRKELQQMRKAGRIVRQVLEHSRSLCKPGVTTREMDEAAERMIRDAGGKALFKYYPSYNPTDPRAFPATLCTSVNDTVVHGIPDDMPLKDGDIVGVDCGVEIDGWCGDSATTILVGNVAPEVRRLCEVTEHVLRIAIENMRPGRKWSQIARLMQNYAEQAGFGVVKEFVGHGIGRTMHEEPKVPNFVSRDLLRNDIELRPGLVVAVEPMCNLGSAEVEMLADGWTVKTIDRLPAAHYEHTLAVTDNGCEVLTDGN